MELKKALSLFIEADHLGQKTGDNEPSDQTLLMLGVVHRRLKKYDTAITYFQKLLERYDPAENPSAFATATHHLAWTYLNMGEGMAAHQLCVQAIKLYQNIEDPRGLSDAYEQLAMIHWAKGMKQKATDSLNESLKLRQEIGNQHGVASCLRHLGTIKIQTKDWLIGGKELIHSFLLYWKMEVLGRQRILAILRELLDWLIGKKKWTA
jgi:tetratricopeptide (TPR) repeat protein